jgi:hypothetical protein
LHVELRPPYQKDVITTIATTTTPQLNTTTTIDIHEPTSLRGSLVKNNAGVHDTASSTVRIYLGKEDSV